MLFKSTLLLPALALLATACETTTKPAPTYKTTTKTPSKTSTWTTKTKTSAAPSPTSTGGFLNVCENFGISVLDCSQLLNIAALNGNTLKIGGTAAPSATSKPVDNGSSFVNACKNFGISVADCAQLLNLAILNGNVIDISPGALSSLLPSLSIPVSVIGGITKSTSGLLTLPTGVL